MKLKYLLLVIVSFTINYRFLSAQSNCEKKITVIRDEFTKDLKVVSEEVKIIDPSGKHFVNSLVTGENISDWSLSICFYKENAELYFWLDHSTTGGIASRVDHAYIKFTDNSVMEFRDPIEGKEIEDGPYTKYIISYFKITEKDMNDFKDKTIQKVRVEFQYQPREGIMDQVISEKKAIYIKNLAGCFLNKISR